MAHFTSFASDNYSAVHPRVMGYLNEINTIGQQQSYEGDQTTVEAEKLFEEVFGAGTEVLFVPTGTGANVLGINLLLERPYDAVATTACSHIYEQESGSLTALTGAQIIPLPHEDGKLDLRTLEEDINMRVRLSFHSALPKVVSIANPTEYGTFYTESEVRAIAEFCHERDMYLHLDGCRLVNVAALSNKSLRECSRDLGVDVMSFGGAKNGLMSAEAVVIFKAPESDFRRLQKQSMQLVSKMRFVSGQFVPYLREEIWRQNAEHANELAQELAYGIKRALGTRAIFTHSVDTNQVFCIMPEDVRRELRASDYRFHDWTTPDEVRLVTAWDNTREEVSGFLGRLQQVCAPQD